MALRDSKEILNNIIPNTIEKNLLQYVVSDTSHLKTIFSIRIEVFTRENRKCTSDQSDATKLAYF